MDRRAVPARRRRVARRPRSRGSREGARSRARPAARSDALARRDVRQRPDVRAARPAPARASARRGAHVRGAPARGAAEDHPELRRARAARGPRRTLDRVPARAARAPPMQRPRGSASAPARRVAAPSVRLLRAHGSEQELLAALLFESSATSEDDALRSVASLAPRSRRASCASWSATGRTAAIARAAASRP